MSPPPSERSATYSDLSVWTDADLLSRQLTLYRLLAHADMLITDYSSVWVDWLLIDRPMAFAIADMKEYVASRGTFQPLEDYLPGPITDSLPGLERAIRKRADPRRPHRRSESGCGPSPCLR